jgi:hypothetical protein
MSTSLYPVVTVPAQPVEHARGVSSVPQTRASSGGWLRPPRSSRLPAAVTIVDKRASGYAVYLLLNACEATALLVRHMTHN